MKDEIRKKRTLNKRILFFILHPSSFILRNASFILCRRGFTLLEVLVALAIISGLLITLIYTVNYQLGIVGRQETVTVATLLAKSAMTELEMKPESKKGKFGSPYEAYNYETAVKDSPYPGVREITVIVTSGKEEVKLNQYIYK
jgi:general secretion pathway protein I